MTAGVAPRAGDTVRLDGRASVQFGSNRGITLRLIAVDSRPTYAGWVWLLGYELNSAGEAVTQREVFVSIDGVELVAAWGRSR